MERENVINGRKRNASQKHAYIAANLSSNSVPNPKMVDQTNRSDEKKFPLERRRARESERRSLPSEMALGLHTKGFGGTWDT